ncbi:hypothetical protein [truncated ORF], partial [Aspergillus niger]|uniref:Uncharacterized protein n=2 Tax=Aspergillus niger TaxID=5061 RepID=A0AAJ8BUM8_ASPNG
IKLTAAVSYLLVSPLLPPVNQFLTLFSKMSLDASAQTSSAPGQGKQGQIPCPKPADQLCAHETLAIFGDEDTFTEPAISGENMVSRLRRDRLSGTGCVRCRHLDKMAEVCVIECQPDGGLSLPLHMQGRESIPTSVHLEGISAAFCMILYGYGVFAVMGDVPLVFTRSSARPLTPMTQDVPLCWDMMFCCKTLEKLVNQGRHLRSNLAQFPIRLDLTPDDCGGMISPDVWAIGWRNRHRTHTLTIVQMPIGDPDMGCSSMMIKMEDEEWF